jgi:hypothetical protein
MQFCRNSNPPVGASPALSISFSQTKKGQPKLPKMPCVLITSRKTYGFFRLCESFQIKNPNPAKNTNMRLTVSTPAITTLSKNMTRLLQLPCCDGIKLSKQAGENIDRDQCRPITGAGPGVKEGETDLHQLMQWV